MIAECSRIPPRCGESKCPWTAGVLWVLLALGGGLILFFFNPSQFGFYPTCLFYKTTGLLCPGCGGLRALHHLLHGEIALAFHFNALLVCSLPFVAWFGARYALRKWRRQPAALTVSPACLWFALALLLLFGLLRNFPFARAWGLAP